MGSANTIGFSLHDIVDSIPTTQLSTSSLTGVMAGCKVQYTPTKTGHLEVFGTFGVYNSTTGDGTQTQLSYGTGTPPSQGDAKTGTLFGNARTIVSGGGGIRVEVSMIGEITGLVLNTKYWFDVLCMVITGGTGIIYTGGAMEITELTALQE